MKVSFEGIGEKAMTFYNSGKRRRGGQGREGCRKRTRYPCADGDKLRGLLHRRGRITATVKTAGFVTAAYTGTAPTLGFCALCADAAGGVKAGAAGNTWSSRWIPPQRPWDSLCEEETEYGKQIQRDKTGKGHVFRGGQELHPGA
jgi:hypothetical protein